MNNKELPSNKALETLIEHTTDLAFKKDFPALSQFLEVSEDILKFSESCVGEGKRKGSITIEGQERTLNHFVHMCRVAALVKYYFPTDKYSRYLALVHDTKEEPQPGQEETWQKMDEVSDVPNLKAAVEILTEEVATDTDISAAKEAIPSNLDPEYIAKYRKFIKRLKDNWNQIGNIELCDRLDGATSYIYLMNPKYENRRKDKALESLGRVWATVNLERDSVVSEEIKKLSRNWFDRLGVTEAEVEEAAKYFE